MTTVRIAESDRDLRRCFPIMVQLRPHLTEDGFIEQVQRQHHQAGYAVAYLKAGSSITCVAGFRVTEMLSRGRYLYVDDLVTDEHRQGEGHATRMLDWLVTRAREEGCNQIDLDSGFDRKKAHRFYLAAGMEIASLHFRLDLEPAEGPEADRLG